VAVARLGDELEIGRDKDKEVKEEGLTSDEQE
jgi:hypothetical protein